MAIAQRAAGWGSRAAACITAAQVITLAALALVYGVELSHGKGQSPSRVAVSIVLMLVVAVALATLTRALWRRSEQARTPTIVWNLLLLPVGWTLARSGLMAPGVAILLTSATALAVVAASGPSDPEDPRG